jgi:hypothetical protein
MSVPATEWPGHTVLPMSEIKQLSTLFFAMLRDIDLIFGMWVYNDKLQIKIRFCSGSMIFDRVISGRDRHKKAKYLLI